MRRGLFVVLVIVAFVGLGRFSRGVRSVDVVGLFASGAMAGAGLIGLARR